MNKDTERTPRKVLGKGLASLLPQRPLNPTGTHAAPATAASAAATAAAPEPTVSERSPLPGEFEDFQSLPVDRISPGAEQPRQLFDEERLLELAQSIKSSGLLQPITVQKQEDGQYRIIAGERRWRAAKLAGMTDIPALVRTVTDARRLELALIENIQREDLNPLEVARAFERLIREYHLNHEEIAERTGKERSTVSNFLRLLRLGDAAKEGLRSGKISMGHARPLLAITDPDLQNETCHAIIAKRFSVRETEAYIRRRSEPRRFAKPEDEAIDPNVRAAVEDMSRALGTKVHLKRKRLEIEFYSAEDLERIYAIIVRQ